MTAPIPAFSNADIESVRPVSGDQPKPETKPASREDARAAGRAKKLADDKLRQEQEALLEQFKSRAGRERDLVDGMVEYRLVPVDDLVPDPDQPRKILRNIAELAKTIKSEGLLQPVTARVGEKDDPKLYLVYGHRRLAAVKSLGWQYVPTMIRLKKTTKSKLVQQLMENLHRDDMDLMDQALGLRELMREEKLATYDQCAERIGKSLTYVTTRIALLDLDESDQIRIINGTLSLTEGARIAREKTGNTRNRGPNKAKPVTSSNGFTRSYGNSGGYVASPSSGGPDLDTGVRLSPFQDRGVPIERANVGHVGGSQAHFGENHYLAGRAASRCKAQSQREPGEHKPVIGTIACGRCWEVVIRLDAHSNPDILYRGKDDVD